VAYLRILLSGVRICSSEGDKKNPKFLTSFQKPTQKAFVRNVMELEILSRIINGNDSYLFLENQNIVKNNSEQKTRNREL